MYTTEQLWNKHKECVLDKDLLTEREMLIAKRSFLNGVLSAAVNNVPEQNMQEAFCMVVDELEKYEKLNIKS